MSDIFIEVPAHYCSPPERPVGSIWRCNECGTYLQFGYTENSWGPTWFRVRWWHFKARRRIRDVESRRDA